MAEPLLTWSQWLERQEGSKDRIRLPTELGSSPWEPTDKDREARPRDTPYAAEYAIFPRVWTAANNRPSPIS